MQQVGRRALTDRRVQRGLMGKGWSTEEIPDLSKKVAVVTGANSGIGFETARELARHRARVVLACRSSERGHAADQSIRSEIPASEVETLPIDLASLDSIRGFADAFLARFDRLDILVNSAGVMLVPFSTTEDGFEMHFGTNHLGHFALTGLLMDVLLATEGSRVVTVSSTAHRWGRIDLDNPQAPYAKPASRMQAYARSKLANLLFTYELQRRLAGRRTIALAAHPGGAATDLGRRMRDRHLYRWILPLLEWLSQSAGQAARPSLRAATDPDAIGGELYGPNGHLGMRGAPIVVRPGQRARDGEAARQLWLLSETLTGVRFPVH